jgi:MFS family permease
VTAQPTELDARVPDSGWQCTLAATALIAIVVGSRSAFGLFLSPINTATGLGLATIGFAAALGQLGQGLAQPLVGALADRHGASRVIAIGAAGYALATALLAAAADALMLGATILLAGVAGTAMGSIAMLLGEVGKRVPAERQAVAMGIVGAGGSAGQLLFGPMTQTAIVTAGWNAALWLTAAIALLALPLSLVFRDLAPSRTAQPPAQPHRAVAPPATAADAVGCRQESPIGVAIRHPAFWLIGAAFAVCGFHMSFLTMHMPGFIERCHLPVALGGTWLAVLGVANIAGSLLIGLLLKRHAPATLLTALHVLRAIFIAAMLALPKSNLLMLIFAMAMGITYMAALPPTTMLVTQTFGRRRLATLFGLIMLMHQLGSFAGVWLGGLAAESSVGYRPLWLVDIALALAGAGLHLPFRRPRIEHARLRPLVARPA